MALEASIVVFHKLGNRRNFYRLRELPKLISLLKFIFVD